MTIKEIGQPYVVQAFKKMAAAEKGASNHM
jgi:hypothetical protein